MPDYHEKKTKKQENSNLIQSYLPWRFFMIIDKMLLWVAVLLVANSISSIHPKLSLLWNFTQLSLVDTMINLGVTIFASFLYFPNDAFPLAVDLNTVSINVY